MYLALETACIEQWEKSRMVDMSVCEQYKIYIAGSGGYLDILINVLALFHAEIYEKFLTAGFDISTASCDLMVSTDKHHFHKMHLFFLVWIVKL